HLFDGSNESCWNSESGSPQHILVEFKKPVQLSEVQIRFQGGFAGKETKLIDRALNTEICALYPEDINSLQTFPLPEEEQTVWRSQVKIQFLSSTDFFGRITIYSLDFVGRDSDAEQKDTVDGGSDRVESDVN
ncbi:Nuclear receptor 2C2-associated protein, partial [Coemansia sp. RSA 2322]